MIIQSIELINFKSYRGSHTLNMSVEPGKPLVIIRGQNGHGKTSILEAILWCLYGDAAFGGMESVYERLNNDAKDAGESMEVCLKLNRKDETWNIVRRLDLQQGGNPQNYFDYFDNGPSVEIDGSIQTNAYETIQSILPHNASQFFLFDGEEIKIYTKPSHHDSVKKAILRVLNLPMLTNAISDLEEVAEELESKERKELKKTGKHDDLLQEHKKVSDEIIRKKEDVSQKNKFLTELETEADQKESILAKTAEKKKQIDNLIELRQDLAREDEKLNQVDIEISELKRRFPLVLLAGRLNNAIDDISEQKREMMASEIAKAERDGELRLLEKLLKNDVCSNAQVPDELRKCLGTELEMVRGRKIETSPSMRAETIVFEEKGRILLGSAETTGSGFEELISRKARIISGIRKIKEAKEKITDEIGESKETEITAITERLSILLRDLIPPLREEIKPIEKRISDLEERKKKLTVQIERAGKKLGDVKSLKVLRDRALLAAKALQSNKSAFLNSLRVDIEEESSKVYRRTTNMPEVFESVLIGENFELSLCAKDGKPFEGHKGSEGQKEVLALSFMAGLARVSGRDAPFVMDSAFIRFDKPHKKNILRFMPKLSKQVVLLVIPETEIVDDDLRPLARYITRVIDLDYNQEARRTTIGSKEGF